MTVQLSHLSVVGKTSRRKGDSGSDEVTDSSEVMMDSSEIEVQPGHADDEL